MMEYWNDVEDKKIQIRLNPLFHHSIIPVFQLRSEAELSSYDKILSARKKVNFTSNGLIRIGTAIYGQTTS